MRLQHIASMLVQGQGGVERLLPPVQKAIAVLLL